MDAFCSTSGTRSEPSQGKQLSLRGIHIKESWAKKIYDGEKTVEARTWKPGCYSGANWVIETPDKPHVRGKRRHAEITGVVAFGNVHEYSSYEEWRSDFKRHCVVEGSRFDWRPEKQKMYGWEIAEARRLATPISAPPVRSVRGSSVYAAHVKFER